jgi:hypothetical protein
MSRCPHAKWGPGSGTTCEKPTNSVATKELEERLQKMREDRAKTDTMWLEEPSQPQQQQQTVVTARATTTSKK